MDLKDNPHAWQNEDGTLAFCGYDAFYHCCKPPHVKTIGELELERKKEIIFEDEKCKS